VSAKAGAATDQPETRGALVIFEVLSCSDRKLVQAWRRRVYASVPNCEHYVTVSMKTAEVVVYDRSTAWKPLARKGIDAVAELSALGVILPLADAYRYTLMGEGVRSYSA
jgi:hypothetical protein